MTIPAKDYYVMWASMAAEIASGMLGGVPDNPTTDPGTEHISRCAIKGARVILDDLGIEGVPPVPPPV
jgi:hypothetical protein